MQDDRSRPWWKFGLVWMVIAGPAVVAVASFVTLYLAVTVPDPVEDDYYHQGIGISHTLAAKPFGIAPAMQARNHAATGVVPKAPAAAKP